MATYQISEAECVRKLVMLDRLRQCLAELHDESLASPLAKRRGVGMLLALREWEIAAFRQLQR